MKRESTLHGVRRGIYIQSQECIQSVYSVQWESEKLPERWKRFRQHVELRFSGPLATKKEKDNCSYQLICCGEKGNDFASKRSDVTDEDRKKLKTYFERFSNHV